MVRSASAFPPRRLIIALSLLAAGCGPAKEELLQQHAQSIVNGTPATDAFLPAIGALVAYGGGGWGQVMSFCSGTLISDRLVLTAAHCVEAIGSEIPAGYPIGFFIGANTHVAGASSKVLAAASWLKHPSYKGGDPPGTLADWYDIGIVRLAQPSSITPLKLVRPAEVGPLLKYSTPLLIVGYGLTKSNDQNSSGAKVYGTSRLAEVGSSEIFIMDETGSRKCSGDSGGPTLIDAGKAGANDYRIVGVASRADQGCNVGSVETRVDAYLSWIHAQGTIPCGSGLSPECGATPPPPPPPPPTKKQLGEVCAEAADCEGNLCVVASGALICSQLCPVGAAGGCPTSYGCVAITGSSNGACVKDTTPPPARKPLGEPCAENGDCASDLCAVDGEVRFCSRLCTPDIGCGLETMDCVAASAGKFACLLKVAPAAPAARSGCAFAADVTGGIPSGATSTLVLLGLLALALRRR